MRYTIENTANIGKPIRVFVNGNVIDNAVIADISRGEVIFFPKPIRKMKGSRAGEVYTRKLRGTVIVELTE